MAWREFDAIVAVSCGSIVLYGIIVGGLKVDARGTIVREGVVRDHIAIGVSEADAIPIVTSGRVARKAVVV